MNQVKFKDTSIIRVTFVGDNGDDKTFGYIFRYDGVHEEPISVWEEGRSGDLFPLTAELYPEFKANEMVSIESMSPMFVEGTHIKRVTYEFLKKE